jgi:tRNA A-37 threonylcarbamoyl transferase component Bud32
VRVPHVYEVHGDALVLEKIDGPTMLRVVRTRPWTLRAQARLLASLHRDVAAADLAHLDLNPTNVILSPSGPVVIDWTNVCEGADIALDAALTYVILATSGGSIMARFFAREIDVVTGLERAAAYRIADRNVTDAERRRVARLVEGR